MRHGINDAIAIEGGDSLNQSEYEIDVAQRYETPDIPLQDNPQHQDDAAGKRNPAGPGMLLEDHHGTATAPTAMKRVSIFRNVLIS